MLSRSSRYCLLIGLFASTMSFNVYAEMPKNYWQLKLGAYTPTGDLDDAKFERSANIEIVYGRYILPNFAIEGGLCLFHAEGGDSEEAAKLFIDRDMVSKGALITPKYIHSMGKGELSIGGGIGIYNPTLEVYTEGPGGSEDDINESDTIIGYHLLGNAAYNFTPFWFLAGEFKYIWQEAEFANTEIDLNGYAVTLNIGLRY